MSLCLGRTGIPPHERHHVNEASIVFIVLEWWVGIGLALFHAGRAGFLRRLFALSRPTKRKPDFRRTRMYFLNSFCWLILTGVLSLLPLAPVYTTYKWIQSSLYAYAFLLGVGIESGDDP